MPGGASRRRGPRLPAHSISVPRYGIAKRPALGDGQLTLTSAYRFIDPQGLRITLSWFRAGSALDSTLVSGAARSGSVAGGGAAAFSAQVVLLFRQWPGQFQSQAAPLPRLHWFRRQFFRSLDLSSNFSIRFSLMRDALR